MSVQFLTSYDASFLLLLLILPFLPLILIAPVYVFYRVFRSPDKRDADYQIVKACSTRFSLICAAASLTIVAVAPSKVPFEENFAANRLLFISLMVAALAFVFAVLSLPRWRGFAVLFIATANYFFIWICVFLLS